MKRHRKKISKLRGHRTHGGGFSKNRRGTGSRCTHRRTWTTNAAHMRKYEPERMHQKGFFTPALKNAVINLGDVQKLAAGKNEIDLSLFGYDKVLSGGTLTKPLTIKAKSFSKKAAEKIEERGGKAVTG